MMCFVVNVIHSKDRRISLRIIHRLDFLMKKYSFLCEVTELGGGGGEHD
jgi:hypothetical protein